MKIGSAGLDINTMLYASAATVIGFQSMIFWVCAKIHGTHEGIVALDPTFERILGHVTLERALLASLAVFLVGLALAVDSVMGWRAQGFHALDPSHSMRIVIPAVTTILLAVQFAYGALFVALLKIRRSRADGSEVE